MILDDGVGASSTLKWPFIYGPCSAAADVAVLVLTSRAASVAKGAFVTATGGTPSASADNSRVGLTLSVPAHHRQRRF